MKYQTCPTKSSKLFENEKTISKLNITPNKEKSIGRTQKSFFESTTFLPPKFQNSKHEGSPFSSKPQKPLDQVFEKHSMFERYVRQVHPTDSSH